MSKRFLILLGALSLFAPALAHGQSPRGWVGVAYTSNGQADPNGNMIFADYPVIETIEPGSPAEKAGLKKGDKILAINSQDLRKEPVPLASMLQPGRRMVFRLLRNNAVRQIPVTVERTPPGAQARISLMLFPNEAPDALMPGGAQAVAVRDMVPVNLITGFDPTMLAIAGAQLRQLDRNYRELSGVPKGVFVVNVAPGSLAMEAGLQSTDVIVRAGHFNIESPGEIARLMMDPDIKALKTIKLQIIRKKKPQVVTLRW